MPNPIDISKFIKKLLAPGEYAKGIKKAVTETDAERLARLSKTHPMIDKATAAQDRISLRELLERIAKDQPTPANKKRLEDFYKEFYGIENPSVSKEITESLDKPKSKIIPSKRKSLKDKELDTFQETLETRVRENPTPENVEVLDNFRKKREAGEYPDLSRALKVAGLAGAIGAGMSLMPDEAEAGAPQLLKRKEIARAILKATSEGKTDLDKVFKELNAIGLENEHLVRGGNILDHVILDRTGKLEKQREEAARLLYPELNKISAPRPLKDKTTYGGLVVPNMEVDGKTLYDPLKSKLFINPELKTQAGEAALLSHEAQHLRDKLKFPQQLSREYTEAGTPEELKNLTEIINANPKLKEQVNAALQQNFGKKIKSLNQDLLEDDISDALLLQKNLNRPLFTLSGIETPQLITKGHHIEYPKNFEWEKTDELLKKGVIPQDELEIAKKMNEASEQFRSALKGNKNKAASIAALSALGAGALTSDAQAAIDGSISQSSPEFSGKQRIAEESEMPYRAPAWLKSPEEVGKSAFEGGMSALETIDKYTGRPTRAALLAALQERNPITAAKEAIDEDKKAEGEEIANELMKKFEQGGMPLRAPGQEEYPLSGILGAGIDFTADPTNLIGTGFAAKGAKFAKTLGRFK